MQLQCSLFLMTYVIVCNRAITVLCYDKLLSAPLHRASHCCVSGPRSSQCWRGRTHARNCCSISSDTRCRSARHKNEVWWLLRRRRSPERGRVKRPLPAGRSIARTIYLLNSLSPCTVYRSPLPSLRHCVSSSEHKFNVPIRRINKRLF